MKCNLALMFLLLHPIPPAFGHQLPSVIKPGAAIKLQKNDVVRMFKTGGHTVEGNYRALIAVRTDGTVIVKTNKWTRELRLDAEQKKDLKDELKRIDYKKLTASINTSGIGPSAADGIDLYISYRKDGKVYKWDNVRYRLPGAILLFDMLDEFQRLATPKDPKPESTPKPQ